MVWGLGGWPHRCHPRSPSHRNHTPPQAAPVVVAGAADGTVSVYSLADICGPLGASAVGSEEAEREDGRRRLEAALRLHTAQQHGED